MHPNVTEFWSTEFEKFFNPETGVDIDGLWIDMNEPTNASEKKYPQDGGKKIEISAYKIRGCIVL